MGKRHEETCDTTDSNGFTFSDNVVKFTFSDEIVKFTFSDNIVKFTFSDIIVACDIH